LPESDYDPGLRSLLLDLADKSRHRVAIYQLSELELLLVARSLEKEQAVKTM
jgi:hypothetical protein